MNVFFDSVDLLCYKISLNREGSYIDSPKWLKNKKATINPQNNDDKCFQYAITAALIMHKLDVIQKEYLILNFLLINIIGRRQISHQIKKIENSLN